MKRILICCILSGICWSASLIADRRQLHDSLIRFHVVAHSDGAADQAIKQNVRDAVLKSMQSDLQKIANVTEAKIYLEKSLPKLQDIVNQTLEQAGFLEGARISLCKERFDIRHYDTFSLPSGVYDSLRIVIGDGLGKNWWCVSFPTLCIPATTSGFADAAVSAGFSDSLVHTLSGNQSYNIRFYLLDQLGRLENIFYHG